MKTRMNPTAPAVRAYAGAPAGIAALIAVCGMAAPVSGAPWHWGAAGGVWSNTNNWLPLALPAPGAAVSIGSTVAAKNGYVLNDLGPTQNLSSLTVSDGMTLHNTAVSNYDVAGTTVVTGSNTVAGPFGLLTVFPSRLWLDAVDGNTLETHNLVVNDGAIVQLDYAFLDISGAMSIDNASSVQGHGVVDFTGAGTNLVNNGTIRSHEGNWWLHFRQIGNGVYDLDGTTGNGRLDLTTDSLGEMRFQGSALSDSFSGTIDIATGAELRMELDNGWTADAGSVIDVTTKLGASQLAVIKGGPMTLGGLINIHGVGGSLLLNSSAVTLQASTVLMTEEWNSLGIGAGAEETLITVNGGRYSIAGNSSIAFHGPTTMHAGEFTTYPGSLLHGRVVWYDDTTWDGEVTVHGHGNQVGDATVVGPTVINGNVFDMSGVGGGWATWDVQNSLVVNADRINYENNTFNGVMNITSNPLAKFTPNLTDASESWTMAGDLNLRGGIASFLTKIDGSPMTVTGDVSVSAGKAQIAASAMFTGSSSIDFGTPTSVLRMNAQTLILPGTEFSGDGTLQNGPAGTMRISNGVGLGDVGLVNEGVLHLGNYDALVAADRFTQTATGTLMIDITGAIGGTYADLLFVGDATLSGIIDVSVLGTIDAAHLPDIGDEFTVMLSLADMSGAFTNDPVSYFGDITLEWSVIYNPDSVVLRLDNIVPSPGACGLLAAAGACMAFRRKRA